MVEPVQCTYKGNDSYFYPKDLKKLLELAILDMHFLFNDILYKQVDGVAMGSPLGPTLANAFMCHWEEKWLRNCPASFKPVLYRRYVDDTFLIFDSPHQIDLFLNYLNSQHENIEFTCDKESDSRLPFLDINVTRGDIFSTSIYRKPTFTGLLSKFSSFCPLKYKENLISTLVFRGYKLNSTFESFHKEIEFLKNILKLNGYPLAFIEKLIKKTLNKFYKVSDPEPLDTSVPIEEKPVFFSSYFLGPFSDKLSKDLKYLIDKTCPGARLQVVYKNAFTVGSLFGFKDKIPESCQACFIYQYTCESCNASYIGKSWKQFKIRVSQHQGISHYTDKQMKSPPHSDIRNHCFEYGHALDPKQFKIIDRTRSKFDLPLLESLHQKIKKPSIGTHSQSSPLLCFPSQ